MGNTLFIAIGAVSQEKKKKKKKNEKKIPKKKHKVARIFLL